MWKLLAFLTVAASVSSFVQAEESKVQGAYDKIKETAQGATTIEEGSEYCPFRGIGSKKCEPSTIFYSYQCCGPMNSDCCFRLQMWVYIVLGVIATLILLSLVISLIRCVFCRR